MFTEIWIPCWLPGLEEQGERSEECYQQQGTLCSRGKAALVRVSIHGEPHSANPGTAQAPRG